MGKNKVKGSIPGGNTKTVAVSSLKSLKSAFDNEEKEITDELNIY